MTQLGGKKKEVGKIVQYPPSHSYLQSYPVEKTRGPKFCVWVIGIDLCSKHHQNRYIIAYRNFIDGK